MLHPSQETSAHSNSSAVGGGNFFPCAHVFNASMPLREISYRPRNDRNFPSDETTNNEGTPAQTNIRLFCTDNSKRKFTRKLKVCFENIA